MSSPDLILYTCGSDIITDFHEVCLKNNVQIKAILNNQDKVNPDFESIQIADFNFSTDKAPFLVPLFTPRNRFLASQEAEAHGLKPFPLLSDRNNDLPANFVHGLGCFINKRVVIGASSKIGNYVLINRGACLGHHLVLEDYVSIGPGVTTGGGVTIKRGAMIGTGAVIIPSITIGKHAVVGAGAVVTKDVGDHEVVMGNPAKAVKENKNVF